MRGRSSRALTRRLGVNAENAPIHAGAFSRKPKQSFDMNSAARAVFFLVISVIALNGALAANDPGHDSLYVLKIGDSNVAGSINITANLTASFVQFTSKAFGSKLDLVGNDTNLGVNPPVPRIMGLTTGLYLDSNTNLYINRYGGTGSVVQVGDPGGSNGLLLNVSGTIYQQNVKVCLANGTNCLSGNNTGNITSISAGNGITVTNQYGPTVTIATNAPTCTGGQYSYWDGSAWQCGIIAGSSSAGGWTNTSVTTSTALNVNVTAGTLTVLNGRIGIGTASPSAALHIVADPTSSPFYSTVILQPGASKNYSAVGLESRYLGTTQQWYFGTGDGQGTTNNNFRIVDLTNSNLDRFVVQPGTGNVGIGTVGPTQKLDVNGSINVSGAGGTIYVGNTQVCLANGTNCLAGGGGSGGGWLNTTTQVYLANNATNVTVDGGVLFVDTASNRVGINTATPKVELDVVGQVNITSGNVTVQQNNGVCFNANCSARMYFNGTAVVIQG